MSGHRNEYSLIKESQGVEKVEIGGNAHLSTHVGDKHVQVVHYHYNDAGPENTTENSEPPQKRKCQNEAGRRDPRTWSSMKQAEVYVQQLLAQQPRQNNQMGQTSSQTVSAEGQRDARTSSPATSLDDVKEKPQPVPQPVQSTQNHQPVMSNEQSVTDEIPIANATEYSDHDFHEELHRTEMVKDAQHDEEFNSLEIKIARALGYGNRQRKGRRDPRTWSPMKQAEVYVQQLLAKQPRQINQMGETSSQTVSAEGQRDVLTSSPATSLDDVKEKPQPVPQPMQSTQNQQPVMSNEQSVTDEISNGNATEYSD